MPIEISLLADRPDLIDQLVEGYQDWSPTWYGPGGRGDARADLAARVQRDAIPCGIVAADGPLAVGTCALASESMSQTLETGAWLVGLWVRPSHRRQGVASRMVKAAEAQAAALRIGEVRVGTVAAAIFQRAGWVHHGAALHDGRLIEMFYFKP